MGAPRIDLLGAPCDCPRSSYRILELSPRTLERLRSNVMGGQTSAQKIVGLQWRKPFKRMMTGGSPYFWKIGNLHVEVQINQIVMIQGCMRSSLVSLQWLKKWSTRTSIHTPHLQACPGLQNHNKNGGNGGMDWKSGGRTTAIISSYAGNSDPLCWAGPNFARDCYEQ